MENINRPVARLKDFQAVRLPYHERLIGWKDAERDTGQLRDIVADQGGRVSMLIHAGGYARCIFDENVTLSADPFGNSMHNYLLRVRQAISSTKGVCFILGGNHPVLAKDIRLAELKPTIDFAMRQHYNRRYPYTFSIFMHHASKAMAEALERSDDVLTEACIVDIPTVTKEGMPNISGSESLYFRDISRWTPVIDMFKRLGVTAVDYFGGEEAVYEKYSVDGEKCLKEETGPGLGCPGASLVGLRDHFPVRVYPQLLFGLQNGHYSQEASLDKDSYWTGK